MRPRDLSNAAILSGVAAAQLLLPLASQPAPASSLLRREINAELTGASLRYSTNITVGNPEQELSLFLSLDSHASWVPDAEYCSEYYDCLSGSYDSSASSSYDDYGLSYFSLNYVDNTYVFGAEFEDTIRVGDTELAAFTLGLATDGQITQGELSIGPSAVGEYSFVQKLVDEGVANSLSYSFWLDKDAVSGNLLFGAVDTSAFDAPLKRVRTRPAESAYSSFPVDFSILNYTRSSGGDPEVIAPQNDLPLILIRPVEMITNLPPALAEKIWELADATLDETYDLMTVPCSGTGGEASELILGLGVNGNATVRVSFDDLIIPYHMAPIGSESDERCVFGIQSMAVVSESSDNGNGPWSLGGFVLRNTYTTFDLVNEEVAFAPAQFSDGGSSTGDVVPFPSYGATIPESEDADPVCPECATMYQGGHRSSSLGIAAIVLMIIGVLLILAGFVTLLWFLWYRGYCCWRGRRKEKEATPAPQQSGPISEKIIYAGALPASLPPRPTLAHTPGLVNGQLPLGCAWVPAVVQYVPAGTVAPPAAEARSVPSAAQPAEQPASTSEPTNPANTPLSRPASPSPSPSTQPSAPPHTPVVGRTKAEPEPSETGS